MGHFPDFRNRFPADWKPILSGRASHLPMARFPDVSADRWRRKARRLEGQS